METLMINKQKFYFSKLIGDTATYESEPYTDSDGNTYYLETGETKIVYSLPRVFYANKADSGGEAEAAEFGLAITDYEAVMVIKNGDYKIPKGSIIWTESPIEYEEDGRDFAIEIDGEVVEQPIPKETSADYRVVKVSKSLNITKLILKAINK